MQKQYTIQQSPKQTYQPKQTGPVGFDPMTCGSEDRRDILTTLRTPLGCIKSAQLYNL